MNFTTHNLKSLLKLEAESKISLNFNMVNCVTLAFAVALVAGTIMVDAQTAIDLGDCVTFAIMAVTSVDFNGASTTVAKGSVGVSPGCNAKPFFPPNYLQF